MKLVRTLRLFLSLLWVNTIWPLKLRMGIWRGTFASPESQREFVYKYAGEVGKVMRHAPGCIHVHENSKALFQVPTLLLVNHRSWLDILILLTVIKAPLAFILKRSLSKLPFIGKVFSLLAFPFIDRHAKDKQRAFQTYFQRYRQGSPIKNLVLFPEGTRYEGKKAAKSPYFGLLKPHSVGLAKVASHFPCVLDVTIDYGGQEASLYAWFSGKLSQVDVHIQEVTGPWIKKDRREIHRFLERLWMAKSEILKVGLDDSVHA